MENTFFKKLDTTLPELNTLLNSSGILLEGSSGTGSEELKIALAIITATPGAKKLMAVPEMVWSAPRFTQAMACSTPNSAPASPPHKKPNQGLAV